jgi:Kef-type K+ transport system membrane component KefB
MADILQIIKRNMPKLPYRIAIWAVVFVLYPRFVMAAESGDSKLISSIGIAILAATIMSFVGHVLKQPPLLAYIAAGVVIGPNIGFRLVANLKDIETISHIGLILLLYLIGLEIDIKKLKESGKSLVVTGLFQFIICVLLGLGFFHLLGYGIGDGRYDLLYLAACCALSSTAIVVKLLYGKFEIDTLAGRITLGVLVFQDIWAIILLGIQPNLSNPQILEILFSFIKGAALVAVSLLLSKYVLTRLFRNVSKIPELVLVSSLGWCFFICGLAGYLDLSLEMGALIAGVAISTFPYNLDVMAKVVNIRDFFVTLFFVALGMQIPDPLSNPGIMVTAGIISVFLICSRFLSVYPILYLLKNGNRISILTSINLAQISEFSLVITALGMKEGHISQEVMSVIIFVFVITSIVSTYMIQYSDALQKMINAVLQKIGLKDIKTQAKEGKEQPMKEIALLGFHRTASSLLREIMDIDKDTKSTPLKDKIVVVDFNPEVYSTLQAMGVKVIYGDIANLDTLRHAGIHEAGLVISTIPDSILVGTDNLKLIRHIKNVSPRAKIIVTAESVQRALEMYNEGADYVFMPRIIKAKHLILMIDEILSADPSHLKHIFENEVEALKQRDEIIR